jgi:hypothetical protein
MGNPGGDEKFFHLVRDIPLFTQNQGLEDKRRGRLPLGF